MAKKFFKKLASSNNNRSEHTFQSRLTPDDIRDRLKGYVRVDNINDVSIDTHVRYFVTEPDNSQRFCLGGFLSDKTGKEYVILNNGNNSWCVQRKTAIFYKKMTKQEEIDAICKKYQRKLDEKDRQIDQYQHQLDEKDRKIKQYRDHINRHIKSRGGDDIIDDNMANTHDHDEPQIRLISSRPTAQPTNYKSVSAKPVQTVDSGPNLVINSMVFPKYRKKN